MIGKPFGPYRILEKLGEGGMGEVHRAHDTVLGRDVAIKILPSHWTHDSDRRSRFDQEARVLASLNHPHIGAIYGIVEEAGVRGLVLELVEGPTLAERISRDASRGLSVAETLAIARQIVDALDAAHERGIVHRDLKPANVKVTADGTVKVLDFGLARLAREDIDPTGEQPTLGATREGTIVGTAAYMSPEQARARPVDKRTDIWAFGCVLYEMVTGRRAFIGETFSDTIAHLLEREPDWEALPRTTPPGLRRVLVRCLEKDPRRRLRDIGDVRFELDATSQDSAAPVAAPSTHWIRSAPVAWLAAATGLAGAAALALPRSGAPADALDARPPVLSRATRVTNTPAVEFGPAISPDNKWVAYYSDARGPTDIWVKFLESGSTLNLTESMRLSLPVRTGIGGLAISPDGTKLAFYARPDAAEPLYDTWVVPMPIGGSPQRLMQGMQGLQWSPDGSRITCILPGSSQGDALVIGGGDGSNPRIIVPAEAGRHIHWPVWSTDGRHIYFIYTSQPWNSEPAEIYRVAASGGALEPIVRSVRRAVYPVPIKGNGLIYAANPDRADLGLWWQPGTGGPAKPLTTGLGEPMEARLSPDGSRLVATLVEMRQSLVTLPVSGKSVSTQPAERAITDGYTGDLDPNVSPIGDRIVFSSSRSGDRNLWTTRLDGTAARPLTSGPAIDERPAFAPDGQQVAFVSDRGGERGIWLVSAGGGCRDASSGSTRSAIRAGRATARASCLRGRMEIDRRSQPSSWPTAGSTDPNDGRRGRTSLVTGRRCHRVSGAGAPRQPRAAVSGDGADSREVR